MGIGGACMCSFADSINYGEFIWQYRVWSYCPPFVRILSMSITSIACSPAYLYDIYNNRRVYSHTEGVDMLVAHRGKLLCRVQSR